MVSRGRVLPFILLVFLFASLPAWGGEVTSGIAEVNGTKLYYEAVGEGQPLVLVATASQHCPRSRTRIPRIYTAYSNGCMSRKPT